MLKSLFLFEGGGTPLALLGLESWQGWHLWVLVAFVIVILEMLTTGFVLGCVAVGAVVAAVADLLGVHDFQYQIWIVAVVSFASLFLVRPTVLRLSRSADTDSNTDRFVGAEVRVSEANPGDPVACAKLGGEVWRIQAQDGRQLQVGDRATVVGVDGNKLIVEHHPDPIPTPDSHA
ncbi:MAG: NfeD family protein [Planctomycetes bacterium]|nr:NfeD family protein [Planctomycetota bacterium]